VPQKKSRCRFCGRIEKFLIEQLCTNFLNRQDSEGWQGAALSEVSGKDKVRFQTSFVEPKQQTSRVLRMGEKAAKLEPEEIYSMR